MASVECWGHSSDQVAPGPALTEVLVQWRQQTGLSTRPCSSIVWVEIGESREGFCLDRRIGTALGKMKVGICELRPKAGKTKTSGTYKRSRAGRGEHGIGGCCTVVIWKWDAQRAGQSAQGGKSRKSTGRGFSWFLKALVAGEVGLVELKCQHS